MKLQIGKKRKKGDGGCMYVFKEGSEDGEKTIRKVFKKIINKKRTLGEDELGNF